MVDRLTLATAAGLPYLVLAVHVGTGLVALAAGFLAITVRKGGALHRRSGLLFVYATIATGLLAIVVAWVQGSPFSAGGALTAYLVFTAFTAVQPLPGDGRRVAAVLMTMAFLLSASAFTDGFVALGRPGNHLDGVPAGMLFFLATVVLLAAIGDFRMLRAGGIEGVRRVARHLWRMSFGLFIASGSFLIGQMRFIPEPIRIVPVIVALAVSPLVLLLYWMWRVRVRKNVNGVLLAPR